MTDIARKSGPDAHYRPDAPDRAQVPGGPSIKPTHPPVAADGQELEGAEPPPEQTPAASSPPSRSAAGIPSIIKTMDYAWRQMGVARSLKTLLKVNQKEGFDCQSCAWPSPDGDRHMAEFCENGAKAVASEATSRRVTPEFFRQWSVQSLAEQSDYWLNEQGRLTSPMVLRRGGTHYEPIAWDDAFEMIAGELNSLASPDEAAFYTSGRTSNEAAFLYQLFVRQFGTNNLPDCSNMCHESSGAAMMESLGVGKGTVMLEDFERTDTIFIIGQNPGTNHPRMLTALEHARRGGATIVAINPLPEAGLLRVKNPNPQEYGNPLSYVRTLLGKGVSLCDLFLPVRINGDVAVLKGMMKEMLEEEQRRPGQVLDHAFIAQHTAGFEEFAADLQRTSWEEVVEGSGLPLDQIRAAGQIAARAKRMIVCWAMGLTQHKNAVDTVQELVNLLLLGGHIGRPGAGTCCVRGHSNVQGDRTMGIWDRPSTRFLDALSREFGFAPPRKPGYDVVHTIRAMHDGAVKAFVSMGGNFLSAGPDTHYTAQALRRCRLTAQVSTKLNRAHLVTGEQALILPCLGRSERDIQAQGEQFVTVEDSMGIISSSRGVLEPASSDLLSETAIVARLAGATLRGRSDVDWESLAGDYGRIRAHISRVVAGFENYNQRIHKAPFYLPNAARERIFKTASGKANFLIHPIPRHDLGPGEFLMMTIRSHDQFNTTVYGLDDRYRGIRGGRHVVFLNAQDIAEHGLRAGQWADLTSHYEGQDRIAHRFQIVAYPIPRRCAATYFPEGNVLVPVGSVADKSNTPTSKSIRITLRPAELRS